MGFFGQNATFSTGGDFEVAEAGKYLCRFKEVVKEQRPSFEDPLVMQDQFKWTWETKEERDSQGNPYRFVKFTGTAYGNDKANLTKLVDGMIGRRLTAEEFSELDIPDFARREWWVMVDEITNGKGNQVNKIMSVKPTQKSQNAATAQARPKPKVDPEDVEDPFEE